MPLLNRKPYTIDSKLTSESHKSTEKGFLIESTGEFLTSYETFTKKQQLYESHVWADKYTGKGGLTYEEAIESEAKMKAQLDKFPPELEETVCRAIHHSIKRLDDLCNTIYASIKDGATGTNTKSSKKPKSEPSSAVTSPQGASANENDDKGDQQQSKKAGKAPVSKPLLRAYIVEHGEPTGPEEANLKIWVVKPSLAARYSLEKTVPAELKKQQEASIPKSKKRPADDKATAAGASPSGSNKKAKKTADDSASPSKKEKTTATTKDDDEPLPPVDPKPIEQVEAQYAKDSIKGVMVQALKAVQPKGLTVQGIIDKAKELNLREFEPKHKHHIQSNLSSDINFVRLEKGVYSIHCYHPDIVVRPKKPTRAADGGEAGPGSKKENKKATTSGKEAAAVVDPDSALGKAKKNLKNARNALSRCKSAVTKAQENHDELKKRVESLKKKNKKSPTKAPKTSDFHIPAEKLAKFELSEAEKEWKGDDDDRKGMLEHRQKMQAKAKELEAAKKKFIKEEMKRIEQKIQESGGDLKKEEAAYRKSITDLEKAKKALEEAEKAVNAAEKKVEGEDKRSIRDKEKEAREKAKAEAKKYPCEDLELLTNSEKSAVESMYYSTTAATSTGRIPKNVTDVKLPSSLSGEEADRLMRMLFVSDFLNQFGKQLGLKACSYYELESMLVEITGGKSQVDRSLRSLSTAAAAMSLPTVYFKVLQTVLEGRRLQPGATAIEKRWAVVVSEATWPEVLRRVILSDVSNNSGSLHNKKASDRLQLAASMLAFDGADALTMDQHVELLYYLVDEILNTERVRGMLQKRIDDVQDVAKDLREEMAEERRKLKELAEAEREHKKKKKEGGDAAAGSEQADAGNAGISRQESMHVEQQPSFELPEELKEYKGDPHDADAQAQFHKQQQAEKRRLDKERNKWLANELRAQREADAKERGAKQAELALQKEKEEAAEALARAQQVLEEKQEKSIIRRQPLGLDRYWRRYWWGCAGDWSKLYVEMPSSPHTSEWTVISTIEELDALIASLDKRGERELGLKQALEKKYDSISMAMTRALNQKGKIKRQVEPIEEEEPLPVRTSARERAQVEFYKPDIPGSNKDSNEAAAPTSTKGTKGKPAAITTKVVIDMTKFIQGVEKTAAEGLVAAIIRISDSAKTAGIDPPVQGSLWKTWDYSVLDISRGALPGGSDGLQPPPTPENIRLALQTKLIELESALFAVAAPPQGGQDSAMMLSYGSEDDVTDNGQQPESRGMSRAESLASMDVASMEVVDEMFSPSKEVRSKKLWKTFVERQSWCVDVKQAMTFARLSYAAEVLDLQSKSMIHMLSVIVAKEEEEARIKKRKAEAAAAPVAEDKKLLGKPPLPPLKDDMRATRARLE